MKASAATRTVQSSGAAGSPKIHLASSLAIATSPVPPHVARLAKLVLIVNAAIQHAVDCQQDYVSLSFLNTLSSLEERTALSRMFSNAGYECLSPCSKRSLTRPFGKSSLPIDTDALTLRWPSVSSTAAAATTTTAESAAFECIPSSALQRHDRTERFFVMWTLLIERARNRQASVVMSVVFELDARPEERISVQHALQQAGYTTQQGCNERQWQQFCGHPANELVSFTGGALKDALFVLLLLAT